MSNLALYRKYRPKKFSDVIGQKLIVDSLIQSVKKNNISHAYIFYGARGTGKTSIAKIFAKAINCQDFQNDCCNKCLNCEMINNNNNIDIIELDAASNNGVNEIKELIETIKYLPANAKYKVYIIDEVHMLSTSAWNALLKSIEEPPKHVIFILATTEYHKIPSTIISRCQRFDFLPLNVQNLNELIDIVCLKENLTISNNAKNKISLLSDGGARDCLSILDQLKNLNENIDNQLINNLFGLIDNDKLIELLNLIINKKLNNCDFLDSIKNLNYEKIVYQLILFLIDKMVYLKSENINLLKVLSIDEIYKINCNDFNLLLSIVNHLKTTFENIKQFNNAKFYFDLFILSYMNNNSTQVNLIDKGDSKQQLNVSINQLIENDNDLNINNIDLNDVFKLKTVTDEYNNDFLDQSINGLVEKENDSYNFNHLVDDSKPIINPYSFNKNENLNSNSNIIPQYDWLEIFLNIASNHNHEIKNNDLNNLNTFKTSLVDDINNNVYKLLTNIEKILVSSQNGVIILFNFKNEANLVNELFWTENSYHDICKFLKLYDRVVYAIDKTKANDWLKIYKENQNKNFPDVKLSLLKYINKPNDNNDLKDKISKILLS